MDDEVSKEPRRQVADARMFPLVVELRYQKDDVDSYDKVRGSPSDESADLLLPDLRGEHQKVNCLIVV